MRKKQNEQNSGFKTLFKMIEPFLYIMPAIILLLAFVYYPFIKNTVLSFFTVDKYRSIKNFAGISNYISVLKDPKFIQSIKNTLIYVVTTVPISILIGLGLALLARKRRRSSPIYEAMFALSMATSVSVMAMIFELAFNPSMGIVNKFFEINISWLSDPKYALMTLIIIQIWHNIGFNFLFLLSAIRGISEEVIESAKIDGAVGLTLVAKIIVPMISPTLLFLLVKDIAYAMTTASFTLILTGGGPNGATETIVSYIYGKAITGTNYNIAFAATTILFAISGVMLFISLLLDKKEVE